MNSAEDVAIVRFFIGVMGATFVCTQFWSSQIFAKEFVGTANATTGGWGNLGGGVTQVNAKNACCHQKHVAYGVVPDTYKHEHQQEEIGRLVQTVFFFMLTSHNYALNVSGPLYESDSSCTQNSVTTPEFSCGVVPGMMCHAKTWGSFRKSSHVIGLFPDVIAWYCSRVLRAKVVQCSDTRFILYYT